MNRPLRILHLSRNFPNRAVPMMGLWAERIARVGIPDVEPTVMAPIPWSPSIFRWSAYPRLLLLPYKETRDGLRILRPRVPLGPGMWLHAFDAQWNLPALRKAARAEHKKTPFDLIHAHFIYPDGVQAAQIGRDLDIPVITTEHAEWGVWFERAPRVQEQVMAALSHIACVTAVSPATLQATQRLAGPHTRVELLPNVVDDEVFHLPLEAGARDPDLVLYAGATRRVKGLDVLVEAFRILANEGSTLKLLVHGDPFYRGWWREAQIIRRRVSRHRMKDVVTFGGALAPPDLALAMGRAAVFVLPSRRETFGVAAAEALACGTPVVATRSGGPEDFVSDQFGALVAAEDPRALALAIKSTVCDRARFDPAALRAEVVRRFGRSAVRARLLTIYRSVLG